MTNPVPRTTSRKRLLVLSILAIIVLAVVWIGHFLINFDLNDYRQQAEEKLSSLLSLPVKAGDVSYNLHDTNLALRVAGLQIGDDDSALQVETPEILIDLQWRGLLARDLKFARISLLEPRIRIKAVANEPDGEAPSHEKPLPTIFSQALLQNINIGKLEVLDGTLSIEMSRFGQPAQQIEVTELGAELTDIKLNHAVQLAVKGNLKIPGQKGVSPWQLQGESSLEVNKNNVLEPSFNLDLNANKLELDAIGSFFTGKTADYSMHGTSDLHLHLEGSPKKNIEFQTGLSSANMAVRPGPAYTQPILFKNLLASGRLQIYGDQPGIKDLSLQIDESRLAGSIGWAPDGQPFSATVRLVNSSLTVPQAKQWLPDLQQAWQAISQDLLAQGSIQVDLAEFTLLENTASQRAWRIGQLKGEFRQVIWNNKKNPAIEILSLPFNINGNLWQVDKGRVRWGSLQLLANGTGKYDQDGLKVTSLDYSGQLLPSALLEEWQIPQHALSINGPVSVSGHLEGPLDQLTLDLQADLSHLNISHPGGLTLTPQPEDTLAINASISRQKISLEHGSIKWSIAKGHISGNFLMGDPDSLAMDALLTINDLSRLAQTLPLLDKLQLHGQAELRIKQRGLPENNRPEVVVTLRDAGLHATSFIADLSQINGRVHLTPTGLVAENLSVYLGQSPLTVQARLEDFTNPHLFLDVKAPSIRADELIFYSDQAMLRDINGRLEIDRDGLSFAPVDVRLDGGTQATVRGTIAFHLPFDTQLEITSEFLHVGEVISLWSNRSEASKQRSISRGERPDGTAAKANIRINALVKHGDLYGMSFHDASGLIVPNHDRLSIHPLDFSVDEGFCNAQILTDFSREGPTLLRISGHAQDVDALEVYRELLNQKNIVRGKLRGDFYLNGEIGSNFLPSSYGNFSIQVHDGVLHQFPVLSKIFSLLNVSQIFALQLPDMDAEGMPFDVLSANFQLEDGILRTEDLKIQSKAMNQSYVGQLNLIEKELDLAVAVQPLGTVDKIVSRIPVAGWLLTGEDKALLTAHFSVTGKPGDVSVAAMPLDTLTEPTIGLLRRTLGLPFKLAEDPQILWGGKGGKE
ncbi:MAG: AsmA-like C-terminal domain-containing protein [Desulfuromonadales bacterium]|nr:AsmA-like C-terminal domain-containing protein [Desulfuromonadales bacterium]